METTAERKALDTKVTFYRAGWFLFMMLIFGPAWLLASSVEGVSFNMAVGIIREGLAGMYFPSWLASLISWPVTAFATLIPGSSAIAFAVLFVVFGAFVPAAFFFTFLYFALVQPPNYRAMKAELDPDWEAKDWSKYPVQVGARAISFTGMIVFLLLSSLAGEVFYGFWRNPIADNFAGQVYLIDRQEKKIPLAATVKLDVIEPGLVYDKKPGVSQGSFHIEFDGKDTAVLKKLGINEKLFAGKVDENGYGSVVCYAGTGTTESHARSYLPVGAELKLSNHYKNTNDSVCPKQMHFGMSDFDNGEFAITDIAKDYIVVAEIKRESRFAFIQRMIMKLRYSQGPSSFYGKSQ